MGAALHAVGIENGKLRGDLVAKPSRTIMRCWGTCYSHIRHRASVTAQPREQRSNLTCPPYESEFPIPVGIPVKAEHPPAWDALESMPIPQEIFKVDFEL